MRVFGLTPSLRLMDAASKAGVCANNEHAANAPNADSRTRFTDTSMEQYCRGAELLHAYAGLAGVRVISRKSQARAVCHSRLMLAGERCMTSAVSSIDRPAKLSRR